MNLGIGLAMLATVLGTTQVSIPVAAPIAPAQTVQQYVEQYFADIPIMINVSRCESRFHQFDSTGSLYRGEINRSDVGVMQINEYYHEDEATKMGMNIHTIQGNVEFARYLYETQGTAPWNSSSGCWAKNPNNAAPVLATNAGKNS